jgi:desulfoferrodoxin (superoxide reductase-like protein)
MDRTNARARRFLMKPAYYAAIWIIIALSCKKSYDQNSTSEPIKPLPEYTLDEPREWAAIAKQHSPVGRKSIDKGQPALLIEVPLEKPDIGHYIEKIGVMDLKGGEIAVETLPKVQNPLTYAYIPMGKLPWRGRVKLFAKCNKHDLWVSEMDVEKLAN